MAQQQQAYKVAGVDEDAPALDARKRKAQAQEDVSLGTVVWPGEEAESWYRAVDRRVRSRSRREIEGES